MGHWSLLRAQVAGYRQPAVAFSGGVDSSLLLAAAFEVHGDKVLAIHACSPLQGAGEREQARAVAGALGCRLLEVAIDPYGWPEVIANTPRRCYHCKLRLYRLFKARAVEHGCRVLLDGSNGDDLASRRPGLAALRELAVPAPLAATGLSKARVRELARRRGLSNWNKPAASCLATRVAHELAIDPQVIATIARGEEFLQQLGFVGSRFRHLGSECRIEVEREAWSRLCSSVIWSQVQDFCYLLGYRKVGAAQR